jgi:hypothetical protein
LAAIISACRLALDEIYPRGHVKLIKKPNLFDWAFSIFGSPARTIVRTLVQPYICSKIKGLGKVTNGLKHKINYSEAYLIMISTLVGR